MPTVIDGITGINRITGGADVGGNLDFVGTGSRITGDFSNATHTNRTIFQTSTANSPTNVSTIPNGTSDTASFTAFNSSAAANCSFTQLFCGSSASQVISGAIGSGTFLPMTFSTNGLERMRILIDGTATFNSIFRSENVTVPKTGFSTSTDSIQLASASGSRAFALATSGTQLVFFTAGASVGSIATTGTTTTYNTSSDYRLKENIRAMVAPLERLLRLKPVLFNWKVDSSDGEGFIAHELQQEVPMAVTGEKDGKEMQGVDASKVVPLLVAAVQELTLKVLALEARLS